MTEQKKIWKLIQKGDLKTLKTSLRNIDIKEVHKRHRASGDSVVHLAARHGFLHILMFFAEDLKIGLELRNLDDKTPLHDAAAGGHIDVVQYLLDNNVPVDSLKKADWTPLMMACTKEKNLSVVKMLLDKGANIGLINKDGWNCFHIACRTGDVDVISHLMGVDDKIWDSRSNNGRTPLHTAALHGNVDIVVILLQCNKPDIQDSCGNTPLMDAVKGGYMSCARFLVERGASLYTYDKLGRSALHFAAECNQTEAIKYFVTECKMNPNVITMDENCQCRKTPLDWAYKENQLEAINTLKELGAVEGSKNRKVNNMTSAPD